jgi:glycogen phosphorylase
MELSHKEIFGYQPAKEYSKSVVYFSMEFAVDQALKIYSGGLGFLAGSHLRSAYELKQNLMGVGILWSYGYYDQTRSMEGYMRADFVKKQYSFLHDPGIVFPVTVHDSVVYVKAYLLKPETFGSAPLFLLTTDIEENDELSRTITRHLYDSNEATRVAQSIVLGIGGATLMDIIQHKVDVYHMNEGHSLPLAFYLMEKLGSVEAVKKQLVFTTHTPEDAGNEKRPFELMHKMSFFHKTSAEDARKLMMDKGDMINYTLAALRFAKIANGVSQMHGEVAREMWESYDGVCKIKAITNSQNLKYWEDTELTSAIQDNDNKKITARKKQLKRELFQVVADQTGKLFKEDVLTMVWARRFAPYKRADLIMRDFVSFLELVENTKLPIQIIWAGKPYPKDFNAIEVFNSLIKKTQKLPNCAVLTGYELHLSGLMKKGSDVWLNTPRIPREASGTSGMTAAMNGSVNFSTPDGWIPEFAKDGKNCFIIPAADVDLSLDERDHIENINLLKVLKENILPVYYHSPAEWNAIVKRAFADVSPAFESGRMADEYYTKLFNI